MSFSDLIGNAQVKFRLNYMLLHKKVPSPLFFTGPKGVGKMLFAKAFAIGLLGEKHKEKIEKNLHPDVHLYLPEGKSFTHPVDSMKEMMKEMEMPPYEAHAKVFIIDDFDAMSVVSSNALLKSLEEPLPDTYVIAISSASEKLPSTILSRMHKVQFFPIAFAEVSKALENHGSSSSEISLLAEGSLGKAYFLLDHPKQFSKERIVDLFSSISHQNYPKFLGTLGEIEKNIESLEEEMRFLGIDLVWEQILYWYRDKEAMLYEKPPLFYLAEKESLQNFPTKKNFSMEKALFLAGEAKKSLYNNIKLKTVLENFFLKLGSFN